MDAIANGSAPVDLDAYRDELKDAALAYIRAGFPITICEGKNPGRMMGAGWHKQTVSAERAAQLIDRAEHPAIGLKQGIEGGILDFDVDSASELIALTELFDGDLPIMPQYTSGRENGEHRLAASDERLNATGAATITYKTRDGKHKVTARIGAGGMAAHSVAPPSLHAKNVGEANNDRWEFTGIQYAWVDGLSHDDVAPPTPPDSVVKKLLAAHAAKHGAKGKTHASAAGVNPAVLAAIDLCTGNMADGNDGSKRLFAACCRGVELNGPDAEIVATIRAHEAKRPFPRAWSDAEIIQRIRDAENIVERGSEVVITNFKSVEVPASTLLSDGSDGEEGGTETVTVPKSMGEIIDDISRHSGGWPRRIDNMLFVDDAEHGLSYFDRRTTAAAFGWLRRRFKVSWLKGGNYASQGEVFAELERTS
jgi:hypothetical protein